MMLWGTISVYVSGQKYYASVKSDQRVPMVIQGLAGTIAFLTVNMSVARIPLSMF